MRRIQLLAIAWIATAIFAHSLAASELDLLDGRVAERAAVNCEIKQSDLGLALVLPEGESAVDFSLNVASSVGRISGPCCVEFRLKINASSDLSEYAVYWVTDASTEWKDFVRVPIRPDGQWHDYRLPIPAVGSMRAIRITLGATPHDVELSSVALVAIDPQLPAEQVLTEAGPSSMQVAAGPLTLRVDREEHRYTITDGRTGRVWTSVGVNNLLRVTRLNAVDDQTVRIGMHDLFTQQPVSADVRVAPSGEVRFEITASDPSRPLSGARFYPPRFSCEMESGQFVFCDRSCGVLLDQRDPTYANWPLRVYGNTHCLDMPWIGLFDEQQGDGLMTLIETPADAEVALVADDQGRHWPEVRWLASLDRFGYARRASVVLTDGGGYVEFAQRYREHLKSEGRFKTLAEKAQEKPAVERLRGAPSLWGGRYPTKFIRQMRPLGITRGVVSNCRDPGIIQWLNDQGYLTGRYDSYTDFVQGRTGFQRDNVASAAVVTRPGGPPKHGWKKRSGDQMYWRSSAKWLEAEASYVPRELRRTPFNARFIDVAAAAEPLEDFHTQHQIDRRQDLANRRALFAKMNDYGLVLGTEHGNDWVADQVEYFEGTMSGPFWWSAWPAGYLDRPEREQLTENYLKFGMGYANRIPLWELVYHDCANTTWYWGDTAGLLYEVAPELADRKDLFNILYGTTPLFWMNGVGYRIPDEVHRMLRSFHDTCQLHQVVAFEQLVTHEFLSDDRAVQRTRFANGTEVTVNFADEPRKVDLGDGMVVLAPRGYSATGPGYSQRRLWVEGSPQTVISTDGYHLVESDGAAAVEGVRFDGRLTAFRIDENRWNVFTDPGGAFEVDVADVCGWDRGDRFRLHFIDDLGELHQVASEPDEAGVVRFSPAKSAWRFALVRDPQSQPKTEEPAK